MLQNELETYNTPDLRASLHIVNYYGCIEQGGKSILLLENAKWGNLAEFLATKPRPEKLMEKYNLWDSFFQLCLALQAMHAAADVLVENSRQPVWIPKVFVSYSPLIF